MRRHARWAVVLSGLTALVGLPAIVASLPIDDPNASTESLLSRIEGSDAVPYSGLYESRGGLAVPDLGRNEELVSPFAETTRVQIWYRSQQQWRADTLTIGGEVDWYREPDGIWRWSSEDRRVTFSPQTGVEPLRFPRSMDLSPAELGRRVVHEADPAEITSIGPRRVGGRVTSGLRISPQSPTTTIDFIDLWVEPATGVVLRVEVDTGGETPILETHFLDYSTGKVSAAIVTFDADASGQPVRQVSTFDVVEQISRAAALIAPATAAVDLPRRGGATALTFGSDFAIVVVAIAPNRGLGRTLNALEPTIRPWGGEASLVQTSLVNVELATINGLNYIIAGTVIVAELDRIAGLISSGSQ